jgi:hypothetical protein
VANHPKNRSLILAPARSPLISNPIISNANEPKQRRHHRRRRVGQKALQKWWREPREEQEERAMSNASMVNQWSTSFHSCTSCGRAQTDVLQRIFKNRLGFFLSLEVLRCVQGHSVSLSTKQRR